MSGLQMKYFVLSPGSSDKAHAEASRAAMRAYAQIMAQRGHLELANDINEWVTKSYIGTHEEPG
jgi:hypothetical protein